VPVAIFLPAMNPEVQRKLAEYLEYQPYLRSPALPSYVDFQVINEVTPFGPDIYAVQRSPSLVSAACIVVSSSTMRLRRYDFVNLKAKVYICKLCFIVLHI